MLGAADIEILSEKELPRAISDAMSSAKDGLDCYFDAKNLQTLVNACSTSQQHLKVLRRAGMRLLCITEIRSENLGQCKEVLKHFDLFHFPRLTGSFLIVDGREYVGWLPTRDGPESLIRITNPAFVESQRFLFNAIKESALPSNQRIGEIGRGAGEEFMETIRDPMRVRALLSDLLRSAVYEVAILFSTRNSVVIAEREGVLDEVGEVSRQGIKVKVLVMEDQAVKQLAEAKLKVPDKSVQVNYLQQLLPTKITTVIVDQAKLLAIEVNDDTKDTFQESVGLSTYSNSESTVFSNVSIFESLWIQAELDKQTKARQTYFQLFKGFKLKDEVYNRRWSSNDAAEKR